MLWEPCTHGGLGYLLPQLLSCDTVDVKSNLVAGQVAQLVECLPSVHETTGSIPCSACNPGTQKMETGGSEVQGPFCLHRGFEASLDI